MKRVRLVAVLTSLLVLLAFTWSFAQMEMSKSCKQEMKMMGERTKFIKKCGSQQEKMCCSGGCCERCNIGCCMAGHGMGCCGSSNIGFCMAGHGMGCCGSSNIDYCMAGHGMGCCGGEFFLCCSDDLELTGEQIASLNLIKTDFLKKEFRTDAEFKIAQLELKELLKDEKASLKEIESKFRSVEKLKTDKTLSYLKALIKAKKLLTPEQLEKMEKHHDM